MDKLNGYLPLKPGSVGSPDIYLGTKLKQMQLHGGIWMWCMSLPSISERQPESKGYRLLMRTNNSFLMGYYPEPVVSPAFRQDEASHYQFLIGVMRWMMEIGCIDINTEVSLIPLYVAMPRQ